ncbi:WG repeat-containing protein [Solibacillus sp. CAU 1738]|uniref:WG repeat-containing protein n=1 Tax=Solibacillus sp. CAU 1738 TaxID=3140363 RepID=UPI0032604358
MKKYSKKNSTIIVFAFLFFISIHNNSYADNTNVDSKVSQTNATSTENFILEPQYTGAVGSFSEGLAFISGYFIDKTGKVVSHIPINYYSYSRDGTYEFKDGVARIKDLSSYGVIDTSGNFVVPMKYKYIGEFNNGFAEIYNNGKFGFINKAGEEIVKPQYDGFGGFSEGYAVVEKNYKYGFINTTGKVVISLKYSISRNFSGGLAAISVPSNIDFKYGFIDKTGKKVIAPQYDKVSDFNEGAAVALINGNQYIIDKTGKRIAKSERYYFYESDVFNDGLFRVTNTDLNRDAFINKKGERISKYYTHVSNYKNGFARVTGEPDFLTDNSKIGFINTSGKEIVSPKYTSAKDFSEGLAVVELNGKYGFINTNGKEVIKPKYEDALSFSEGLAAVKINGKWGYIENPLKKR